MPATDDVVGRPVQARSALGATGGSEVMIETADDAIVPGWLANLAALGWRVLAVAGMLIVIWFLGTLLWTVTASVAVAIVVAAVFAPLVLRLRVGGRSRNAAAAIVWAAAILTISAALLLMALAFVPYLADLASRLEAGLAEVQAALAAASVPGWVDAVVQDAAEVVRSTAGDAGGDLVASAASAVTIAILASFLVFFFLRDGDKAWLWMFQALGEQKRERITAAGDTALGRVGGYLRGTTVLSALTASTDLLFMLLLGVPLAVPLAVFAFFAGFIPYFGTFLATALILLVSFAAFGTGPTLVLLVLMGVRGALLGYLVRPAVYGRTVKIHPALVLLALPAGFQLAGIVGLFAAVPVAAVLLAVASAAREIVEPDPRPVLPGLIPGWLDRLAQFSWRILIAIALIGLFVAALLTIPLVIIPLIIALLVAATLNPVVRALERRGRTRSRSAVIAVGGGFIGVVGILALTFASLFTQASTIGDTVTAGVSSADEASGGLLGLPDAAVTDGAAASVQAIAGLADATASIVAVTVLGTLLAFYFLRDGKGQWGGLLTRLRPETRPQVDAAATRAFDVLGGYMIGTAAISFVGAASQLVIMLILDLPLALPVFVLSFFLGFIPYIGGLISTGIALLIAVAVGSTSDIVVMGIWTIVFNIVQGNVVSPLMYGRTVHIHPAIVLVAIPAASAIAGIMGMFVVVPAIGVVATTWRTVLKVMGDDTPVSVPDTADDAPGA
jgi:putative heme transporter